jgi:hypothetical protein
MGLAIEGIVMKKSRKNVYVCTLVATLGVDPDEHERVSYERDELRDENAALRSALARATRTTGKKGRK